jgi:hypothetical protein
VSESWPIWLTILIAAMTGLFALGGQALGGFQTRKSQAQLFSAQRRAGRADEERKRLEELYSCFTIMFDNIHEAVTRYRRYKRDLISVDLVKDSIGANDNENYKRMMVLLNLYYPELGEQIAACLKPAVKCQNWLVLWKVDSSIEELKDFDEDWDTAMDFAKQIAGEMSEIAKKID